MAESSVKIQFDVEEISYAFLINSMDASCRIWSIYIYIGVRCSCWNGIWALKPCRHVV